MDRDAYIAGDRDETSYTLPEAPVVSSPASAYALCRSITRSRVEIFLALLLTTRHGLIRKVRISKGSLSAAVVHPREVFRPAIVASAASLILAHNHPSGDPEPSTDDVELTRRLVRAGKLLGIPILDHVIVVRSGFVSLRRQGTVAF